MFKRRFTKWEPLGCYHFGGNEYIVFARRRLKTGMVYFKVKNIQRYSYASIFIPHDLIDVKKQWEIITKGE